MVGGERDCRRLLTWNDVLNRSSADHCGPSGPGRTDAGGLDFLSSSRVEALLFGSPIDEGPGEVAALVGDPFPATDGPGLFITMPKSSGFCHGRIGSFLCSRKRTQRQHAAMSTRTTAMMAQASL
jgi:hypothetical protein